MESVRAWITVQEEWCKACALCIEACKPGILQLAEHFNPRGYHPIVLTEPDRCTGCMACALVCPDAVIEVYRREKAAPLV